MRDSVCKCSVQSAIRLRTGRHTGRFFPVLSSRRIFLLSFDVTFEKFVKLPRVKYSMKNSGCYVFTEFSSLEIILFPFVSSLCFWSKKFWVITESWIFFNWKKNFEVKSPNVRCSLFSLKILSKSQQEISILTRCRLSALLLW